MKRMRWKAIMYDTGCNQNRNVEKYGLKTLHSPKQVKELSAFEKDLIAVVKDIKFRNARSDFQTTLQEDRLIHNSKKTMTFADKTSITCTNLQKRNTTNYYGTQLLRSIKRQIQKSKIK